MDQVFSVLKFIGIILEVLVIFNLLIIVHEWGHFLAARWRGAVVEGFGVWFGKPLWKKKINGVTYSLGSIPFGGFVKLPQLMDTNLEGQSEFAGQELPRLKPVDKIIIAAAGPLFSILLAFTFALIVWGVGRPVGEAEKTVTIGFVEKDSPAEKAHLQPGDKLVKIDGHPVTRFGGQSDEGIQWRILRSEGETIDIDYVRDGQPGIAKVVPEIPKTKWYQRSGLRQIGLGPQYTTLVAKILAGGPAEKAGLQVNDRIVGVNGQPIFSPDGILDAAESHPDGPILLDVHRGADSSKATSLQLSYEIPGPSFGLILTASPAEEAGLKNGDRVVTADGRRIRTTEQFRTYIRTRQDQPVALEIERPLAKATKEAPTVYEKKTVTVTPRLPAEGEAGEEPKPSIGVVLNDELGFNAEQGGLRDTVHTPPFEQIVLGVKQITGMVSAIASKSNIGVQHMGGPVMMMRIYYLLFQNPDGWRLALWFSVIINVNLALLNLLPIPPLDGSHITLGIIEIIRGKPVKGKLLEYVMTPFTLLVIGFMIFVTFHDVQDLFGGKKSEMRFKARAEQKP